MIVSKSLIEPWSHPAFAPLPEIVLFRLSTVNSIEMPDRNTFDNLLSVFLAELVPELRETAALTPDIYAAVCCYISRGDPSNLSDRMRMWATLHHVCSGSNKYNLLLLPRDAYFAIEEEEEERLRADYVSRIDRKASTGYADGPSALSLDGDHGDNDLNTSDQANVFERLPVQAQIYDVLVYAHRTHLSSSSMLFEIRRLGMVSAKCSGLVSAINVVLGCYNLADGGNVRSNLSSLQLTSKADWVVWSQT
jgi:hypothetical protein